MESTFDMAWRTFESWTPDQCAKMIEALRQRLSEQVEDGLNRAGLPQNDPLYRPITEGQLLAELLEAQEAYENGDYMDALAFCDSMEQRHT